MASEVDGEPPKQLEKVNIKVTRCKGLHGTKSGHLTSTVRVEFGSTLLGESPKSDADSSNVVEYDFGSVLNVSVSDPHFLDDLVQTPLVVTVIEILPKDKRAKEEKTHVLGQCCVDLLPLLRGQCNFSVVQPVCPVVAGNLDVPVTGEQDLPEIEISIFTANPLLSDDQLDASNLMKVCIESAYSIPETWSTNAGQYMYSVALPMPIASQKEASVILPNGTFRAAGEKETTDQRKWSAAPSASGSCLYIPNSFIAKAQYENEVGDLRDKEDVTFRVEAENEKAHVTWNGERRVFLSTSASEGLQTKIAQNRFWPVEIIRASVPQVTKAKGKTEDDVVASFHGVAYVDLAPFLYPGVRKIRGAYLLKPFIESELQSKTNRTKTLIEEATKITSNIMRNASSLGHSKLAAPKGGKADAKPKGSVTTLKPENLPEVDSSDAKHSEGQQYIDARTYIVMEFELEKPLVPKREQEILWKRVAEFIPPRPQFPKKVGGAKRAIEDFRSQIGKTADLLLEEFRAMFKSELSNIDGAGQEVRRRQFLYELNTSGKYFAFKEQLKYFVVKVVREKFMNTVGFESRDQLQAFISELYQFLLDQMHIGLNKYLSTEETTEIPPPVTDSAMLKHFAKEAEVNFDFELAAKYYQERLARNKNDPDNWLDYGSFCLSIDDIAKAEECFREAVSIDQRHVNGLILSGCIAVMQDEQEKAELLFETATCAGPESLLAWTMFGLYYAGIENDILAERAFNEAIALNIQNQLQTKPDETKATEELCEDFQDEEKDDLDDKDVEQVIATGSQLIQNVVPPELKLPDGEAPAIDENIEVDYHPPPPQNKNEVVKDRSIFLQVTEFLLERHALQMVSRALANELVAPGCGISSDYYELLAQLHLEKKEYHEARECLDQALMLSHENPDAWSLMGHIHYLTGQYQDAKAAYERTFAYTSDAKDVHTIYLRLASIYLREQEFSKAKQTYLEACSSEPSCITWLGAGIASYRLDELSEAEYALNEANILDNRNAEVWAYLTLVCLKGKRHQEAEQSYKYTIKAGLADAAILEEIKLTMVETDFDMSVL